METIYTLEGWVKEAINNEQADILQQFCKNAVGEAGRKALVELAESHFDFWTGYCRQLETDNITAVYITVYANVMSPDGLLCKDREGIVYRRVERTSPQADRTRCTPC